jgi:hypothetical protein
MADEIVRERPLFYTDENMPEAVALQGARKGIDVLRCQFIGLMGVDDDVHLEYAAHEGRVVLTRDYDFVGLHYQWLSEGRSHAGIIYVDESMGIGQILWVLELFVGTTSADELRDKLEFAKSYLRRR